MIRMEKMIWETNLGDYVRSVSWSPNGKYIAVGGGFKKVIVFGGNGGLVVIVFGGSGFSISVDGEFLGYDLVGTNVSSGSHSISISGNNVNRNINVSVPLLGSVYVSFFYGFDVPDKKWWIYSSSELSSYNLSAVVVSDISLIDRVYINDTPIEPSSDKELVIFLKAYISYNITIVPKKSNVYRFSETIMLDPGMIFSLKLFRVYGFQYEYVLAPSEEYLLEHGFSKVILKNVHGILYVDSIPVGVFNGDVSLLTSPGVYRVRIVPFVPFYSVFEESVSVGGSDGVVYVSCRFNHVFYLSILLVLASCIMSTLFVFRRGVVGRKRCFLIGFFIVSPVILNPVVLSILLSNEVAIVLWSQYWVWFVLMLVCNFVVYLFIVARVVRYRLWFRFKAFIYTYLLSIHCPYSYLCDVLVCSRVYLVAADTILYSLRILNNNVA